MLLLMVLRLMSLLQCRIGDEPFVLCMTCEFRRLC